MMDEGKRLKDKLQPPTPTCGTSRCRWIARVGFDQLIYNVDRNTGNLHRSAKRGGCGRSITHARSDAQNTLKAAANVTRCDRQVIERSQAAKQRVASSRLGSSLLTIRSTAYSREGTRSSEIPREGRAVNGVR